MTVLEVTDLTVSYGPVEAVRNASLTVAKGEIVTILGANGAGKSSIMQAIAGLVRPKSGSIRFGEQELSGVAAHDIARNGISLVPEGKHIFNRMTVRENLLMGAYGRTDREAVEASFEEMLELFPRLRERLSQRAGTLSGGEQQMLAIARGLMANVELLLLDEPSLGLAPIIVGQIFELLPVIVDKGITILLVEQNANAALGVSDRGYLMTNGRIVDEDTSVNLLQRQDLRKEYLGG